MEFIPALSQALGIRDQALLEKDVRLHHLLHDLTHHPVIGGELIFKGGTCLIKCHLDYPRFSVDLDFTWRDQHDWQTLPTKRVRDATRQARYAWLDALIQLAQDLGYGFDRDEDVTWGSSSRMGTAVLRYTDQTDEPAFAKVQVNFVEPLHFPLATRPARTLITGREPKALRLYESPVLEAYRAPFDVTCYDPQEIAAEKCRAILTRRAPKGRDLLDLYLLQRDLGVDARGLEAQVRAKLDFALSLGDKYQLNLHDAPERFRALAEQDIQPLMLRDIDHADFDAYRTWLLEWLEQHLPEPAPS